MKAGTRGNVVSLVAIATALVGATVAIRTKIEAAREAERAPPATKRDQVLDELERVKRRLSRLQALAAEKGFYWEQECPDELPIDGVYPQLIYDRTMK